MFGRPIICVGRVPYIGRIIQVNKGIGVVGIPLTLLVGVKQLIIPVLINRILSNRICIICKLSILKIVQHIKHHITRYPLKENV